jgi:hypothetical protein
MFKSEWKHFFVRSNSGMKLEGMREELDREINAYLNENAADGWRIVSIECLQRDRSFDVTAEAEYRFFWERQGAALLAEPEAGSAPADVPASPTDAEGDPGTETEEPPQEEVEQGPSEEVPQEEMDEETPSDAPPDAIESYEDEDFGIEFDALEEEEGSINNAPEDIEESGEEQASQSEQGPSSIEQKASILSEIFSEPLNESATARLKLSPVESSQETSERSGDGHDMDVEPGGIGRLSEGDGHRFVGEMVSSVAEDADTPADDSYEDIYPDADFEEDEEEAQPSAPAISVRIADHTEEGGIVSSMPDIMEDSEEMPQSEIPPAVSDSEPEEKTAHIEDAPTESVPSTDNLTDEFTEESFGTAYSDLESLNDDFLEELDLPDITHEKYRDEVENDPLTEEVRAARGSTVEIDDPDM